MVFSCEVLVILFVLVAEVGLEPHDLRVMNIVHTAKDYSRIPFGREKLQKPLCRNGGSPVGPWRSLPFLLKSHPLPSKKYDPDRSRRGHFLEGIGTVHSTGEAQSLALPRGKGHAARLPIEATGVHTVKRVLRSRLYRSSPNQPVLDQRGGGTRMDPGLARQQKKKSP